MEIYLLRHTKPDVPPDTCYGQSDIDVVEQPFRNQLPKFQKLLPLENISAIYTSPLQRCYKLAENLSNKHQDAIVDERIGELDFGEWELQPWSSINPRHLARWKEDFLFAQAPGGESHMDLYQRVEQFWDQLLKKEHPTSLIVTHGGVIKSLLSKILDMPLRKSYAFKIHYGELIYISIQDNAIRQMEFMIGR
ncbi:MAG TPA: alpha-ribazole phosphatase [Bacteroidales bacterium]|nr:alpha-ribazole phosphatase [Bacteroidales bacterium]